MTAPLDQKMLAGHWRRMELTVAWLDLDRLLHAEIGFSPLAKRHPSGVWRAWLWPQLRSVELKLGLVAHQALQMTSQSAAGRMGNMFSPRTVQGAKALTLGQLMRVHSPLFGRRRGEA